MANDDNTVLAPNATIVNHIEKDPPTAAVAFDYPHGSYGAGYVFKRDGYTMQVLPAEQEGMSAHHFATVGDLASYLKRNFSDRAMSTDIVIEEHQIMVYIDPTAEVPQIFKVELDWHPAWDAWKGLCRKHLTQMDVIQHCRAWRETMSDSEAIMQALGSISIIGASKFTSMTDETGAIRLSSTEDSRDLSVKIPPTVRFECPVYDGIFDTENEPEEVGYPCELLVSVDTSGSSIEFEFSFPKLELVKRQARRDAGIYLQALLGDDWLVSVGTAHHGKRDRTLDP